MNKSEPVLGFLAPTSCDTSPFCQPSKGPLHNPTTSGEPFLTRDRTIGFWFISPSLMFNMLKVALGLNDFMHILKVIASVRTKMLFTVGSLSDDMHDQVIHRPLVMFIGACNP